MFRKFLKDYFTFSRSERNGIIVLIAITFILIAARIAIPHIRKNVKYDFSEFQDEIAEFEKSFSENDGRPIEMTAGEKGRGLTFFDPNTATREEFQNTGLDDRVIRNILKYRENGGKFSSREDLKKIWGLDSVEYLRVEAFIIIKDEYNDTAQLFSDGLAKSGQSNDRIKRKIQVPLNISDSNALAGIYGIGPVLSARIIKYRKLLGGYVSKEQLLEVYGMTQENYENIRDFIFIDSVAVTRINLNTTGLAELSSHPYLNDYQARALISYREINGKYVSTDEIIRNNLLPDNIYVKIKPYLVTE
jgi:competence protein ComEA